MRIAYVCYWSAFVFDGVAKKIVSQVERWRAAGNEADVFCLTPPARGREQQLPARTYAFASAAGRSAAGGRLLRDLRAYSPDAVYLRYDLLPPPLHLVTRRWPVIVELNSDDQREARLRARGARAAWAYGVWNWRRLCGHAAGIVAVSSELARLVERYGRPVAVIGNGIELEGIVPTPPLATGSPRLLFSGTPGQAWHGVDEILELARRRPDIEITLLGSPPDPSLPPNVTAHGYLERAAYEPLFAAADIALGSAALHRNGLTEASPLKVREYLAYGLPVVLPYEDTDLRGVDSWWLERVPNENGNLAAHAEAIVDFAGRARGRRVPREEIEDRIGAAAKEQARLGFIAGVLP